MEWGRLRRPGRRRKAFTVPGRGRRKRPLPAQPNPRPYGDEAAPEAQLQISTPVKREWCGEGDASVPTPLRTTPAPTGVSRHTSLVVVRVPLCPCLCATYETNETSETSETSETNETRFNEPTLERRRRDTVA